jgi:hypothetical protein
VPENVKGYDGAKSCVIMLILFLIAPGLSIPAFNLGGKKIKWVTVGGKKGKRARDRGVGYPLGELKVGFTSLHNGHLLAGINHSDVC